MDLDDAIEEIKSGRYKGIQFVSVAQQLDEERLEKLLEPIKELGQGDAS